MLQTSFLENRSPDALLNPYHFPLDTLSLSNDSSAALPFLGTPIINNTPDTLLTNFGTQSSILFYISLLILIAIAGTSRIYHVPFLNFFKIGLSEKFLQDHERKQISNNRRFHNLLFGCSLFFITVIGYAFCNNYTHFLRLPFLSLAAILSLAVITKILLQWLLCRLFDVGKIFQDFFKSMRNMYASILFIMSILSVISLSANPTVNGWIFLVAAFLWIAFFLYRDVRFLLQQITKKQSSFYFFMYFCTIEIFTVPLLIKLVYLFGNQWFVE